jgi:diaminopimelate epimerase
MSRHAKPQLKQPSVTSMECIMDIEFIKMHGAGNDYVYFDLLTHDHSMDFHDLAQKISSRHFGVGGDGLVLITASNRADYRMRMFNADGSEAEMCGNAIRCVGKYLWDRGRLRKSPFKIDTLSGVKKLWVVESDAEGKALQLKVDMGEPILKGKEIPVTVDREPAVDIPVGKYRGTAVSMGNPHFVIFVDSITDEQVLVDGPKLESDPHFPKKTNVEFVAPLDRNTVIMRVWERGSGETMACGTGACATVVASALNNITEREVLVKLKGGDLRIEWNREDNRVYMTGQAVEVFQGVYHYSV